MGAQQGSLASSLIMLALMFGIFYFFLISPAAAYFRPSKGKLVQAICPGGKLGSLDRIYRRRVRHPYRKRGIRARLGPCNHGGRPTMAGN